MGNAEGSPALFAAIILVAFACCCTLLWRSKGPLLLFPVSVGLALLVYRTSWRNTACDALLFAAVGYIDYGIFLWLKKRGALPKPRPSFWKATGPKEARAPFIRREAQGEQQPANPGRLLSLGALLLTGALLLAVA